LIFKAAAFLKEEQLQAMEGLFKKIEE